MRQTFADEIVNAGWEFPEDTVVIKLPDYLGDNFDDPPVMHFTKPCIPVFDNCIVVSRQIGDMVGCYDRAYLYQLHDKSQAQYIVTCFAKGSRWEGNIGFGGRQFIFTFDEVGHWNTERMMVRGTPCELDDFIELEEVALENGVGDSYQMETSEYLRVYSFPYSLSAFYLLHQKAEVELVTPSRQVSRQIERKTGKKPSPYFEIKIDPSKPQKRYTSTRKTGRSKNAHIVRGNFATYTDEAPLFGKYTGTFFRHAHARGVTDGDKPNPKNYRIVLPEIKE